MKTYPKYKESGIPWIGQIPEDWKVQRLKSVATLINGYTFQSDTYCTKGNWDIITIANVQSEGFDTSNCKKIEHLPKDIQENQILHCGDLLISMTGNVGRVCFVTKENCLLNQRVGKLIVSPDINKSFLFYLLSAPDFISYLITKGRSTAQMNIGKEEIGSFPICIPPLTQQQAIADYLDKKTGNIDELVGLLNKQIADVRAYRQSLITETVTQGLNKDVPMKDSGIEWIGQIPEGWKVMKLPYILDNLDYLRKPIASEKRSRNNPRYNYYGASGVIDKIDEYNVEDKVLLIGEDGANLVMRNLPLVYKAEGKFWVNNHAHILKPKANANYDYFYYFLELVDYTPYITGSAQPKLSQDNLNKVLCVLPSLSEQESIAHFLDAKTKDIDELLSKLEAQVADLLAYKSSLISEVVTGKIDIR